MLQGEYRLSYDIDLICPEGASYRQLRNAIAAEGTAPLFDPALPLARPPLTDMYAVRFRVGDPAVKVEVICEARIPLEPPVVLPAIPVPCLHPIDQWATKLLANADRWNDASTFARDLIDLCILARRDGDIPEIAIAKAEQAYAVLPALVKAIAAFQSNPQVRDRCFAALRIDQPAVVIDGLDQLAVLLGSERTQRQFMEIQAELDPSPLGLNDLGEEPKHEEGRSGPS